LEIGDRVGFTHFGAPDMSLVAIKISHGGFQEERKRHNSNLFFSKNLRKLRKLVYIESLHLVTDRNFRNEVI